MNCIARCSWEGNKNYRSSNKKVVKKYYFNNNLLGNKKRTGYFLPVHIFGSIKTFNNYSKYSSGISDLSAWVTT